jgi:hypothetical protein
MKLKDLFNTAIKIGIDNDPRDKKELNLQLKELKDAYNCLPKDEKELFDKERLTNPYGDSHISFDSKRTIKTVAVGIDMETPEVLLVNELNRRGKNIDAIWGHHPEDKGLAMLAQVMAIHKFCNAKAGIPISIAEHVHEARIAAINRAVAPANHTRPIDATKLLNITYFNTHTPADNCVWTYLSKKVAKAKPRKLKDVVNFLLKEPEYKDAVNHGAGPAIFYGSADNFAGRVVIDMTGGTEGAEEIYKAYARAGVGTLVGMHYSEKHKKAAEKAKINLVVAGHMASDNIGMNILIDNIEKKHGKLKIVEMSGFKRFKRK